MELYIYDTADGTIADFRPYLDGRDHSFDDHRPLKAEDPRWEKINNLYHPRTGALIGGDVAFVGTATTAWRELMMFPILWDGAFDPVEVV